MKNAIITGATGMIGSLVLKHCLESSEIGKITSISRKPIGITHPKLEEIIWKNFLDFANIHDKFANQEVAYFCVGVYTGQVSKEKFREINVDIPKAFAQKLKEKSPNATFCFLSGQGADQTEKSKIQFARDKGIAENKLLKLGFQQTYIFRPSYIYPVQKRKEPNFSYRLMRKLYPILKNIFPKYTIKSTVLAEAMFLAGLNGNSKSILENEDIKRVLT